jgi:hypothetical protein
MLAADVAAHADNAPDDICVGLGEVTVSSGAKGLTRLWGGFNIDNENNARLARHPPPTFGGAPTWWVLFIEKHHGPHYL